MMYKLLCFLAVLVVAFAAPAPEPGGAYFAPAAALAYKPLAYAPQLAYSALPAAPLPYGAPLAYPAYPGYPAPVAYGKIY